MARTKKNEVAIIEATNVAETNVQSVDGERKEVMSIAAIARMLGIDEKIARGRLRTAQMRNDGRVYDATTRMWKSIRTEGDTYNMVVSIMRGKRAMTNAS